MFKNTRKYFLKMASLFGEKKPDPKLCFQINIVKS